MASLWVHGTPENAAARFSTAMTVGFQPTPGAPVPPKNADDEVRVGPTSPSLRPRFRSRSRPARAASSQRRRSVNDGMRVDELQARATHNGGSGDDREKSYSEGVGCGGKSKGGSVCG